MALTESAVQSSAPPHHPPHPRRSLMSRLSLGHVVMILAGLIAILLNLALLNSDAPTFRIAVAGRDLPAGSTLGSGMIDIVEIGDAGAIASGLVSEDLLGSIAGNRLNRPISQGEPIRPSDITARAVDPSLREMSIEIERGSAAGGRLTNGDLVDVITVADGVSAYVASGIEVVEVRDNEGRLGPSDGYTVIVSVDARTALAIAAAQVNGVMQLTRSTGATPPRSEALVFDLSDLS